jgi:hypothetical protein
MIYLSVVTTRSNVRHEGGDQITLITQRVKFGNSNERLSAMDDKLNTSEGAISIIVDA